MISTSMSPELAAMPDAKEIYDAGSILARMNRDPTLAEFALRAKGSDVSAKVREFVKIFDKAVDEGVSQRFKNVLRKQDHGALSPGEFLSMAQEVQSEDTSAEEKDKLIGEMVSALKSGRVR